METQGTRTAIVEPDADDLIRDGRVVTQVYKENPDITMVFGIKDNTVVIKSFVVPDYYDEEVVQRYVSNTRRNNASHNCPYCRAQEEKARALIAAMKKKLEARQPPEPEYEEEIVPEEFEQGFRIGNGNLRRPFGGQIIDNVMNRVENRPRLFRFMQDEE